tara:strand:+ start:1222 stop:2418 length:1197 start_codon:yes stop_codon:yes gene_type:complete
VPDSYVAVCIGWNIMRIWFTLFYIVKFIGVGFLAPYVAMFFLRNGFSNLQAGFLVGLISFVGFVAQPLWGIVSDRYMLTKRLITISCFSTAVIILGYLIVDNFNYLVLVVIGYSIMRAPLHANVAALALSYLEENGKKEEFGSLRLWGSAGYIVATFASGALLFEGDLDIAIYIFSGCCLILGFMSFMLPERRVYSDVDIMQGAGLVIKNSDLRLFLIGIIFIGITLGASDQYLAIYMDEINSAAWIVGAAVALTALPEIPLMRFAEWFIARWGIRNVFVIGVSVLPIRWIFNIYVTDPYIAFPVQVLHGIAMSALLSVGVIYVDNIVSESLRASGQSLYLASLYGLGPSIGLFLAGILMESEGATTRPLWVVCLVTGTLGSILINSSMKKKDLREIA